MQQWNPLFMPTLLLACVSTISLSPWLLQLCKIIEATFSLTYCHNFIIFHKITSSSSRCPALSLWNCLCRKYTVNNGGLSSLLFIPSTPEMIERLARKLGVKKSEHSCHLHLTISTIRKLSESKISILIIQWCSSSWSNSSKNYLKMSKQSQNSLTLLKHIILVLLL